MASSHDPIVMLQSIRGNIAALQRQWAVISSQPDGPTKTNAQQHLASQLKRLQMMEQSAIQSMGAHIPPGAQLNQPQQQGQMGMQPQQQQQQNAMMQGLNPAQLSQMQPQQGINGLGMDSNFGGPSQQGDMNALQQQQQQQHSSNHNSNRISLVSRERSRNRCNHHKLNRRRRRKLPVVQAWAQ